MKKRNILFLGIILLLLVIPFSSVLAAGRAELQLCEQEGVITVFKFGGYALFIIKILVPLLIIIMGTIDLAKAMIAGKSEEISKQAQVLVKRAIAGVIIFFIPTIISFAFGTIESYANIKTEFSKCTDCLLNTSKCK